MVDVTDRMNVSSRHRAPMVREGSGLSGSSSLPGASTKDLRAVLCEIEPIGGGLSPKEVDEIMQTTAKIVGDTNIEWTKRLNILKTFRSLCSDPAHHAQIVAYLRHLMPPLQSAVKDLRSQLGREACIAVAHLANQLGAKAEFFMEPMLPSLFSLLVANAKVVSITGSATLLLVYESIPSWRLLPPLQSQMLSKSKEVRRAVCSCIRIVLLQWPPPTIQKHANIIHEVMKKGLTDADAEARNISRECFPVFQGLFPGLASSILDSLEPLQKRQLMSNISLQTTTQSRVLGSAGPPLRTNGTHQSSSLTRQGSLKKTGIPVLAARVSPVKTVVSGRSTSAIDLQAANRAKQHHFNTLRTPLRTMGRTNSSITSPVMTTMSPNVSSASVGVSGICPSSAYVPGTGTNDRSSRTRSRISRLSHSQPGSRSNSPSSKYSYATYSSPYAQQQDGREGSQLPVMSPPGIPGKGIRRFSATSSASSSRDTSPQGRMSSRLRSRSVSQSPQIVTSSNPNSSTAKLLLASREAESALAEALRRDISEIDFGNHSDSEDSLTSHRSFLSETFSPPSSGRHHFIEDNVEELLNKCGSAKWSERKEGLLGLQNYLQRRGSLPSQYFNRIGQTFCRIFMDAHTKVLSLFLDVLHAVLYRHAKDLVDFTTILLNRVLTKLGSDLLTSVQTKLMKTLEIIMDEMPPDLQFSAVAHYLCDPTQTPNSRSRVAALCHLYNLSNIALSVKVDELQHLVEKILDWCGDMRSPELRRMSQKVFHALFDMAAPQMTLILGQMAPHKQDQAKLILKNHVAHDASPRKAKQPIEERINIGGEWNAINSDMQSLKISQNDFENDLMAVITQMSMSNGSAKGTLVTQLLTAIKESDDSKLTEHHKEILKVIFDTLAESLLKSSDRAICFYCLEEMCNRSSLSSYLAAFAELFIVRVTDVQTPQMPREVTKAAESCGMSLAFNFPPEILTRALCPIVQNREFPVNQMAIKMLQRMCESCETLKLRALFPDIISTLIIAYDHPDSAVRKASVFAIVAIHIRLGSDLDPYLSSLSGSKLKLLQLYIQRAQQGQTGNGS